MILGCVAAAMWQASAIRKKSDFSCDSILDLQCRVRLSVLLDVKYGGAAIVDLEASYLGILVNVISLYKK